MWIDGDMNVLSSEQVLARIRKSGSLSATVAEHGDIFWIGEAKPSVEHHGENRHPVKHRSISEIRRDKRQA